MPKTYTQAQWEAKMLEEQNKRIDALINWMIKKNEEANRRFGLDVVDRMEYSQVDFNECGNMVEILEEMKKIPTGLG